MTTQRGRSDGGPAEGHGRVPGFVEHVGPGEHAAAAAAAAEAGGQIGPCHRDAGAGTAPGQVCSEHADKPLTMPIPMPMPLLMLPESITSTALGTGKRVLAN